MAQDKIQTILDWPELWKVKDIQAFLGFTNFYHRFIQGYSNIVVPLTCLTHKGVPWSFSNDCQESFLCPKEVFTPAPVLVHWIPDAPITVETDTSDYAVAAILSITCSNNEIHPVAFHSHTLSGVELNYNTHDKKLLMIFKVSSNWHHYLEGSAQPICRCHHGPQKSGIFLHHQAPDMPPGVLVRIPLSVQSGSPVPP